MNNTLFSPGASHALLWLTLDEGVALGSMALVPQNKWMVDGGNRPSKIPIQVNNMDCLRGVTATLSPTLLTDRSAFREFLPNLTLVHSACNVQSHSGRIEFRRLSFSCRRGSFPKQASLLPECLPRRHRCRCGYTQPMDANGLVLAQDCFRRVQSPSATAFVSFVDAQYQAFLRDGRFNDSRCENALMRELGCARLLLPSNDTERVLERHVAALSALQLTSLSQVAQAQLALSRTELSVRAFAPSTLLLPTLTPMFFANVLGVLVPLLDRLDDVETKWRRTLLIGGVDERGTNAVLRNLGDTLLVLLDAIDMELASVTLVLEETVAAFLAERLRTSNDTENDLMRTQLLLLNHAQFLMNWTPQKLRDIAEIARQERRNDTETVKNETSVTTMIEGIDVVPDGETTLPLQDLDLGSVNSFDDTARDAVSVLSGASVAPVFFSRLVNFWLCQSLRFVDLMARVSFACVQSTSFAVGDTHNVTKALQQLQTLQTTLSQWQQLELDVATWTTSYPFDIGHLLANTTSTGQVNRSQVGVNLASEREFNFTLRLPLRGPMLPQEYPFLEFTKFARVREVRIFFASNASLIQPNITGDNVTIGAFVSANHDNSVLVQRQFNDTQLATTEFSMPPFNRSITVRERSATGHTCPDTLNDPFLSNATTPVFATQFACHGRRLQVDPFRHMWLSPYTSFRVQFVATTPEVLLQSITHVYVQFRYAGVEATRRTRYQYSRLGSTRVGNATVFDIGCVKVANPFFNSTGTPTTTPGVMSPASRERGADGVFLRPFDEDWRTQFCWSQPPVARVILPGDATALRALPTSVEDIFLRRTTRGGTDNAPVHSAVTRVPLDASKASWIAQFVVLILLLSLLPPLRLFLDKRQQPIVETRPEVPVQQ
ncbi:MAG: hypothetical protein MHM6MM_000998 [Cercozoa sp. M6MM]